MTLTTTQITSLDKNLLHALQPTMDYSIYFKTENDKVVGRLNLNGDKAVFEGDMDESAAIFFDSICRSFENRLIEERKKERKDIIERMKLWL